MIVVINNWEAVRNNKKWFCIFFTISEWEPPIVKLALDGEGKPEGTLAAQAFKLPFFVSEKKMKIEQQN